AAGMRLGRDAIVLTQKDTMRSIGFLSQSMNEGKYNVETPIVSYCRQGSLMEVNTTVQTSEGGEKLRSTNLSPHRSSANEEKKLTTIYRRILSVHGSVIVIGDKKFEFLAFSSSQLRDNSAWMFASQNGLSSTTIRQWMGEFREIRNVTKHASRLGQSFSSSKETLIVNREEIEVIHDVEIESDMKFIAHKLAALGPFGLFTQFILRSFSVGSTNEDISSRFIGMSNIFSSDLMNTVRVLMVTEIVSRVRHNVTKVRPRINKVNVRLNIIWVMLINIEVVVRLMVMPMLMLLVECLQSSVTRVETRIFSEGNGDNTVRNVRVKEAEDEMRFLCPALRPNKGLLIVEEAIQVAQKLQLKVEVLVRVQLLLNVSNLVTELVYLMRLEVEFMLVPDAELLFCMSNLFAQAKRPGSCLGSRPGTVDDGLVVIVLCPYREKVKLLGKVKLGGFGVKDNRAMVRADDEQVMKSGIRKEGAPENGDEGSVKPLLSQITPFTSVRPSERYPRVSQVNQSRIEDEVPERYLAAGHKLKSKASEWVRSSIFAMELEKE
ncbi:hypothetical protein GIB67_012340, partial [Kingdonia uniflora]